MRPRPFRLMASTQVRYRPLIAKALHSTDAHVSCLGDDADDPLGFEWPPGQLSVTAKNPPSKNTSRSPQKSLARRSADYQTIQPKFGMTAHDRSSNSKVVLKSRASQTPSASPISSASQQEPPKHVKEGTSAKSTPDVALDPLIVHPLKTYSYKDHKPCPSCIYVRDEEEADRLVGSLSGAVGFDIEWKVIFCKGSKMRPAATVQLSDQSTILVIQVSAMKVFPNKLKELLESTLIVKVGVNILNDGKKLARDYGIHPQGLVELGGLARQADARYVERYFRASEVIRKAACTAAEPESKMRKPGAKINLATVTAMYTGCELPKGPVRVSDWEVQPLSEMQLDYAANDAHSALVIYDRLITMAKARNVTLIPAKYTSGVGPGHGVSDMKPKVAAPKTAPIFQAPALTGKASSSSATSSSTSFLGSGETDSATLSTSAVFGFSSSGSTVVKTKGSAVERARFKPAFPVSYASVSDSDVEILGYRHVLAGKPLSALINASETEAPPSDSSNRGRTGPRFKPSYSSFPRMTVTLANVSITNEARHSSPSKDESRSSSMSSNPPPERSPRFKPSYNTTVPRPASSEKLDATPSNALSESTKPLAPTYQPSCQRTQHIRAYNLWHVRQLPLAEICGILRSRDNPLKASTVISYVVTAIQTDPRLRFSRERLRALLVSEPKSWLFYRDWFRTLNAVKYVNMDVGAKDKESKHEQNTAT